jgi:HlyD family secretion protein
MATKSKRTRRVIVFGIIGLLLAGLTAGAILKRREVPVTVQTEKVARRDLTEIVVSNGKIQPVVQVKISPEVSGEIITLPVKEGQHVEKGELLVKIKPDFYIAARNQAEASYKSSVAARTTAEANLRKADAEFRRGKELFQQHLISESSFDEFKANYDVASAQLQSATHGVEMANASLASADDSLSKTTIVSPIAGTVSKLNSQLGERVLGTIQNVGTEIMTVADLNEMEARVDIGETDVVLIKADQHVRLEVDAFKKQKFNGTVTEIANSSTTSGGQGQNSGSSSQEATKFSVKIRIKEKEMFRPGMSVSAEIETRSRTNVLSVPMASVTTRLPAAAKDAKAGAASTNAANTNVVASKAHDATDKNKNPSGGKNEEKGPKEIEVVFVADGDHAKMVPVKIGISDDNNYEIVDGLKEGQEIVTGNYRAISRDLEDGKAIKRGPAKHELAKADDAKK